MSREYEAMGASQVTAPPAATAAAAIPTADPALTRCVSTPSLAVTYVLSLKHTHRPFLSQQLGTERSRQLDSLEHSSCAGNVLAVHFPVVVRS